MTQARELTEVLIEDDSEAESPQRSCVREWLDRLMEFGRAVVPLSVFIIVFCGLVIGKWFFSGTMCVGLACVIVGLTFFKYGLLTGLMPFAESIGATLPGKQSELGMIGTTGLLGMVVTFAEPGVASLQMVGGFVDDPAPLLKWLLVGHPFVLLSAIAAGVGVAASLGMIRIRRNVNLSFILLCTVPASLVLTVFSKDSDLSAIVALAWDSGAITTGPATVPIVLALGNGLCKGTQPNSDDEEESNGFGVITLASILPILSVLLCGIIVVISGAHATEHIVAERKTHHDLKQQHGVHTGSGRPFFEALLTESTQAIHSIAPLSLYMLAIQLVIIRERLAKPREFAKGVAFAFVGLATFNMGLYYGSLKLGDEAGHSLPNTLEEFQGLVGPACILFFGFVCGLTGTFIDLEPCGLGELVEGTTNGLIKKFPLYLVIGLGAGTGVAVGFARVIFKLNLNYILCAGYFTAIALTLINDNIIVCVAWDAAGATTGPVTVPLVLSLGIGIADVMGDQAFGILACAALFPIIGVLLLGLVAMPAGTWAELKERVVNSPKVIRKSSNFSVSSPTSSTPNTSSP